LEVEHQRFRENSRFVLGGLDRFYIFNSAILQTRRNIRVNSSGFNHPCQCLISIGQLTRSSNFLDNFFLSSRLEDILIANF